MAFPIYKIKRRCVLSKYRLNFIPKGPTGPQGPQGVPGPVGSLGDQGPQGANGSYGANGNPGPVGPRGPAGLAGVPGAIGNRGPTGIQGTQGPSGVGGSNTYLYGSEIVFSNSEFISNVWPGPVGASDGTSYLPIGYIPTYPGVIKGLTIRSLTALDNWGGGVGSQNGLFFRVYVYYAGGNRSSYTAKKLVKSNGAVGASFANHTIDGSGSNSYSSGFIPLQNEIAFSAGDKIMVFIPGSGPGNLPGVTDNNTDAALVDYSGVLINKPKAFLHLSYSATDINSLYYDIPYGSSSTRSAGDYLPCMSYMSEPSVYTIPMSMSDGSGDVSKYVNPMSQTTTLIGAVFSVGTPTNLVVTIEVYRLGALVYSGDVSFNSTATKRYVALGSPFYTYIGDEVRVKLKSGSLSPVSGYGSVSVRFQ